MAALATTITLKDGSKVAEAALVSTSMNLETLHNEDYIAFFDLVEKC